MESVWQALNCDIYEADERQPTQGAISVASKRGMRHDRTVVRLRLSLENRSRPAKSDRDCLSASKQIVLCHRIYGNRISQENCNAVKYFYSYFTRFRNDRLKLPSVTCYVCRTKTSSNVLQPGIFSDWPKYERFIAVSSKRKQSRWMSVPGTRVPICIRFNWETTRIERSKDRLGWLL